MSKAKVISVLNHKGGVGKTTTRPNRWASLRSFPKRSTVR